MHLFALGRRSNSVNVMDATDAAPSALGFRALEGASVNAAFPLALILLACGTIAAILVLLLRGNHAAWDTASTADGLAMQLACMLTASAQCTDKGSKQYGIAGPALGTAKADTPEQSSAVIEAATTMETWLKPTDQQCKQACITHTPPSLPTGSACSSVQPQPPVRSVTSSSDGVDGKCLLSLAITRAEDVVSAHASVLDLLATSHKPYRSALRRAKVFIKLRDLHLGAHNMPAQAVQQLVAEVTSCRPGTVVVGCAVRAGCVALTLDLWQLEQQQPEPRAGAGTNAGDCPVHPHTDVHAALVSSCTSGTVGAGAGGSGGEQLVLQPSNVLQWLQRAGLEACLEPGARVLLQLGPHASLLTRSASGNGWGCEALPAPDLLQLTVHPVAHVLPAAREPGSSSGSSCDSTSFEFTVELSQVPRGWTVCGWSGGSEAADRFGAPCSSSSTLHCASSPLPAANTTATATQAMLTLRCGRVYIPLHVASCSNAPSSTEHSGAASCCSVSVCANVHGAALEGLRAAVAAGPGVAGLQLELCSGGLLRGAHPMLVLDLARSGTEVVQELSQEADDLAPVWSDWLADLSDWAVYSQLARVGAVAGKGLRLLVPELSQQLDEQAARMHSLWMDVHGDLLEQAHAWGLHHTAALLQANAPHVEPQPPPPTAPGALPPTLPGTPAPSSSTSPPINLPSAGPAPAPAAQPQPTTSLLHDVMCGFAAPRECAYAAWVSRQVAPVSEAWSALMCAMITVCCARDYATQGPRCLPALLLWGAPYLAMGVIARRAPHHLEAAGMFTVAGRCLALCLPASGLLHMPASYEMVVATRLEFVTEPLLYTTCEQARVPLLIAKRVLGFLGFCWLYTSLGAAAPVCRALTLNLLAVAVGVALDLRHRCVSRGVKNGAGTPCGYRRNVAGDTVGAASGSSKHKSD